MGTAKGRIFLCRELPFSVILAPFKICIAVAGRIGVEKAPLLVFGFGFKIFGIDLLDLIVQRFIGRFIIPLVSIIAKAPPGFKSSKVFEKAISSGIH